MCIGIVMLFLTCMCWWLKVCEIMCLFELNLAGCFPFADRFISGSRVFLYVLFCCSEKIMVHVVSSLSPKSVLVLLWLSMSSPIYLSSLNICPAIFFSTNISWPCPTNLSIETQILPGAAVPVSPAFWNTPTCHQYVLDTPTGRVLTLF